jgi:hypothetical protein
MGFEHRRSASVELVPQSFEAVANLGEYRLLKDKRMQTKHGVDSCATGTHAEPLRVLTPLNHRP